MWRPSWARASRPRSLHPVVVFRRRVGVASARARSAPSPRQGGRCVQHTDRLAALLQLLLDTAVLELDSDLALTLAYVLVNCSALFRFFTARRPWSPRAWPGGASTAPSIFRRILCTRPMLAGLFSSSVAIVLNERALASSSRVEGRATRRSKALSESVRSHFGYFSFRSILRSL